jgi:uncharacterized membrane protein
MTDQAQSNDGETGAVAAEVEFMSAERLIFFSDAVVAIAITLLALALSVPDVAANTSSRQVFEAMWHDHAEYFAFLISFVVIANHWRSHHRLFRHVARLDNRIVTINLVWLLMVVLMPFATRLLSANGGFGARFTVYAAIQIATLLAFALMSRHIKVNRLLRPGSPASFSRADDAALLAVAGMFALSIPVSFVTEWAFAFWIASAFAARTARRRMSPNPL